MNGPPRSSKPGSRASGFEPRASSPAESSIGLDQFHDGGDLASTGSNGTIPIVIGGAAVLAAGTALVVVARRRKQA
ncbi:LPXTG cell wall anchor domain-containing protein [Streptomyces sp. NPDC005406]|uniref:LPXTG cell wall anchor domain-containing protein n=1 Tax=Streptomyces sp. NPDC005406 TaxID=3155339 RepID=UPI003453B3A7